jgi:hypothetical protein
MSPLCIQSQLPCRKGWQFVSWTGDPGREDEWRLEVRRQLAQVAVVPSRLDAVEDARRLADAVPPIPNPSPFVVSAPSLEWRLWSTSECFGL